MYRFLSAFMLTGLLLATNVQASLNDIGVVSLENDYTARPQSATPNPQNDAEKKSAYIGHTYIDILAIASRHVLKENDASFFMGVANDFKTGSSGERHSLNIGYFKRFYDLAKVVETYKFPTDINMTSKARQLEARGCSLEYLFSVDVREAVYRVAREATTASENYFHNVYYKLHSRYNQVFGAVHQAKYSSITYMQLLEQASSASLKGVDLNFFLQLANIFKNGQSGKRYALTYVTFSRFTTLLDKILASSYPKDASLRNIEIEDMSDNEKHFVIDLYEAALRVRVEATVAADNYTLILDPDHGRFTMESNI
jgi:hypothetical protein